MLIPSKLKIALAAPPANPVADSIVAVWPLTESASAARAETAGYGEYDLAVSGGDLSPISSGVLTGVQFVAGRHLEIAKQTGPFRGRARSISWWMSTSETTLQAVFSQGVGGSGGTFEIRTDNTNGAEILLVVSSGSVQFDGDVNDGALHHVVFVVPDSGSTTDCLCWIDGVSRSISSSSARALATLALETQWGHGYVTGQDSTIALYQPLIARGEWGQTEVDYVYNAGSGRAISSLTGDRTMDVYIFAGQSNSSGQAAGTPPLTASSFIFDYDSSPNVHETLVYSVNHEHGTDALSNRWGAEQNLFKLHEDDGKPQAIALRRSVTSTDLLSDWSPNGGGGTHYNELIAAIADLKAYATTYSIALNWKGFVWAQGERDGLTSNATAPSTYYEDDLNTLISNVRSDTSATLKVSLVTPKIGASLTSTYDQIGEVQTAIAAVAAADANIDQIDTSALTQSDDLHFDASAQNSIGSTAYTFFNP